jgi:hypothetical protein
LGAKVTQTTGTAEWEAVDPAETLSGTHQVTLDADKNYDTYGFIDDLCCS